MSGWGWAIGGYLLTAAVWGGYAVWTRRGRTR